MSEPSIELQAGDVVELRNGLVCDVESCDVVPIFPFLCRNKTDGKLVTCVTKFGRELITGRDATLDVVRIISRKTSEPEPIVVESPFEVGKAYKARDGGMYVVASVVTVRDVHDVPAVLVVASADGVWYRYLDGNRFIGGVDDSDLLPGPVPLPAWYRPVHLVKHKTAADRAAEAFPKSTIHEDDLPKLMELMDKAK